MGFVNGIKGFLIGVALVIPGLSGSIFAVVVGLYDKLLYALNHFTQDPRAAFRFLLPVAVGGVAGILLSTKGILWLCEAYPIESYMFFIGLVLGSVPLVLKRLKQIPFQPLYLLLSFTSFAAVLFLTRLSGGTDESVVAIAALGSLRDFGSMVFAGAFSVSLMAIPGVSGSVMLMVIRQYGTVYHAVGAGLDFIKYLLLGDLSQAAAAFQSVLLMGPFILGAAGGLLLAARLMGYLLERFEAYVYYCVAGLLLAAVVVLGETGVLPHIPQGLSPRGGTSLLLIAIVCVVTGVLCTLFLDRPEEK